VASYGVLHEPQSAARRRKFMASVLDLPKVRTLLWNEHFSVDGMPIAYIDKWA
jgi:hypothetical protein